MVPAARGRVVVAALHLHPASAICVACCGGPSLPSPYSPHKQPPFPRALFRSRSGSCMNRNMQPNQSSGDYNPHGRWALGDFLGVALAPPPPSTSQSSFDELATAAAEITCRVVAGLSYAALWPQHTTLHHTKGGPLGPTPHRALWLWPNTNQYRMVRVGHWGAAARSAATRRCEALLPTGFQGS